LRTRDIIIVALAGMVTALPKALIIAGESEPRATGEVVWVHADQATMRAAPLPPDLLELLDRRSKITQQV
jgi:hypothetical protein